MFEIDLENWGNFSSGYLLGMHADPNANPVGCPECWEFGHNMQLLNYGINYVIISKAKWIDQNKIAQLDVTSSLAALLDIYHIFLIFLLPLDHIFQDKKLMWMTVQLFNVFMDPSLFDVLVTNFVNKGSEMAILILTMPGSSCFTIGYRVAALEKFIFGVLFEDPPSDFMLN